MTVNSHLVLSVDGGGSKTSVWLGEVSGIKPTQLNVLGKAVGGPGNVRSLGFEAALGNVQAAIAAAFQAAGLAPVTVSGACLSLAGAGRAEEQAIVLDWCRQQRIADSLQVVGDAEVVLAAATPVTELTQWPVGIGLIAGTGSMAWGRNAEGATSRCGGWGYLFGDEGSAFDLGRRALQLASREADGRSTGTEFSRGLLNHLRLDDAAQLVGWCYADAQPRARIASLAPFVFARSKADEAARQIVADGAHELAELVAAVASRLQLPSGKFVLACAGSVLVKQPDYVVLVKECLEKQNLLPSKISLVADPVAGALRLAAASCLDR